MASLGFGSGLLLLALSVVASVTQLFALSTSVLLGDQSDDHRCYAAEKHTIQTRIFFFFKGVPETLFSHLETKGSVPKVNHKVCLHPLFLSSR